MASDPPRTRGVAAPPRTSSSVAARVAIARRRPRFVNEDGRGSPVPARSRAGVPDGTDGQLRPEPLAHPPWMRGWSSRGRREAVMSRLAAALVCLSGFAGCDADRNPTRPTDVPEPTTTPAAGLLWQREGRRERSGHRGRHRHRRRQLGRVRGSGTHDDHRRRHVLDREHQPFGGPRGNEVDDCESVCGRLRGRCPWVAEPRIGTPWTSAWNRKRPAPLRGTCAPRRDGTSPGPQSWLRPAGPGWGGARRQGRMEAMRSPT